MIDLPMEFIPHPSYREQCEHIDLILSKITIENLNKIFERFNIQCLSFEHLQTSGRINSIFNIKTQSINSSVEQEFILKISNPHRYWKKSRTKNEAVTMQYLFQNTTIPVPKILDYSCDSQTSILSCEYILMQKISGKTLETVIDSMPDEFIVKTALELTDYIKQLRQIKFSDINQIGSFANEKMSLSATIEDGPTLGPFSTVKEYIIAHLRWSIKRIQTNEHLFTLAGHLLLPLEKVIGYVAKDEYFTREIRFHFTHTDLNSSNILVDEHSGQILSILDWERTAMTFLNNDMEFFSSWLNDNSRKEQLASLLGRHQNYADLTKEMLDMKHIELYSDVMYAVMYATFYSSTWFQREEEVNEHIEHFIKEAESAVHRFDNHILTSEVDRNSFLS